MTLFKNHIAINSTAEVVEICKPLKNLNVDFFCYHRVFLDGSEIMLSNSGGWAEHSYRSRFLTYADIKYSLDKGLEYVIWPYSHQDTSALRVVREMCGLFYGLSFITKDRQYDGYMETFGFGLSKSLDVNLLLNHIDLLKNFCFYFRCQAEDLIGKCKHQRIIPVEYTPYIFPEVSGNLDDETSKNKFIKEIRLDQYYHQKFGLTAKELRCVDYLLLGKTALEIANTLYVSPRTVETHLMHIKDKLQCATKSELIAHLIKIGFAPSSNLLNETRRKSKIQLK